MDRDSSSGSNSSFDESRMSLDKSVLPKPSQPKTHENQPGSLPKIPELVQSEEIETYMADFESKLNQKFQQIFEKDVQLPLWRPNSGSDTIQSHITDLKIPYTSSKHPSLLLHNLGQPSHDPQLATRVSDLFDSTET
jgi:hypothetical protein